jgi:hypothetical protein
MPFCIRRNKFEYGVNWDTLRFLSLLSFCNLQQGQHFVNVRHGILHDISNPLFSSPVLVPFSRGEMEIPPYESSHLKCVNPQSTASQTGA